ncbi:GNAT family N-acetyltransferase [Lacticaseibacillus sharpeae]|uniref:GNAT family N-acetyltransferase n=1 Tax=Lacticaseibacillus sharpeae TaxID=1626 RepID=UPI0006D03283|nr:GNAT family N-acetyltransferase [Lacticaseibacillus sharpeae]
MSVRDIPLAALKDQRTIDQFSCIPLVTSKYPSAVLYDYQLIDDFLHKSAIKYDADNLMRTRLIVNDDGEILAFYSLCAGTRRVFKQFRHVYSVPTIGRNTALPTIELVWFGVAAKFQNQGIGSEVLKVILRRVLKTCHNIGACLFVVDSLYVARNFYLNRGFVDIGQPHKQREDIYLGISMTEIASMISKVG